MTKPKQTSVERTVPRLVAQAHGGALRAGGTPGNRGGAGAPPSELRARLRGSASERVAIAEEIADDPDATNSDRLRAIELLLKFGLSQEVDLRAATHVVSGVIALPPEDEVPTLLARTTQRSLTDR